jgi:hypothetical protein
MGWVKNWKSNSGLEMRYIYSIYTISDDKVEPSKYRVLPLLGFCMLLCEVRARYSGTGFMQGVEMFRDSRLLAWVMTGTLQRAAR